MAFTKVKLSGSTDGKQIPVAATASPGTTIHQAHATNLDEIWLWAVNVTANPVKLTIEYGGNATGDLIELTIEPESGLMIVIPGSSPLTNSLTVAAFGATASAINIQGYVNRIS